MTTSPGAHRRRHLIELGHTQMAVLAGEPYASTGRDRTQGFVQRCQEAGLAVADRWVVEGPFHTQGGRAAMQRVLDEPGEPPTAVFAVNDFAAIGAMGAIRDAGLRVGYDIAVVGFNDVALAAELPIPMTTVASPMEEMGRGAVTLLLKMLAGEQPTSLLLQPEIKVRASSDVTQLKELDRFVAGPHRQRVSKVHALDL